MENQDPFSASEDEMRRVEEWWLQKGFEEDVDEEDEEETAAGEDAEEGERKDADDLIYDLKGIGMEDEDEDMMLRRMMEELGDLSSEELLDLARDVLQRMNEIHEERERMCEEGGIC